MTKPWTVMQEGTVEENTMDIVGFGQDYLVVKFDPCDDYKSYTRSWNSKAKYILESFRSQNVVIIHDGPGYKFKEIQEEYKNVLVLEEDDEMTRLIFPVMADRFKMEGRSKYQAIAPATFDDVLDRITELEQMDPFELLMEKIITSGLLFYRTCRDIVFEENVILRMRDRGAVYFCMGGSKDVFVLYDWAFEESLSDEELVLMKEIPIVEDFANI